MERLGALPTERLELDFGTCRLAIAGPLVIPWQGVVSLVRASIASDDFRLRRQFLDRSGIRAAVGDDDERLVAETTDLRYHLSVLLAVSGIDSGRIAAELERRARA